MNVPDVKNGSKIAKETLLKAAQKLVEAGKFASIDEAIVVLA
jgi:hypothetical protein